MAETSANDPASLIAQDLPKAIANLNDIKNVVKSVNTMIANITNRIKKKELPTNEGMSFLDVKNQMLIQYLTNLAVLFLRKCSGESIKDTIAVGMFLYSFTYNYIYFNKVFHSVFRALGRN